jgi:hypothetical protein
MTALKRGYRALMCEGKKRTPSNKRFALAWMEGSDLESKSRMLSLASDLLGRLSDEEREVVWPMVLARTLYEHTNLDKDFLYSQQDRDDLIAKLAEKYTRLVGEGITIQTNLDLARMGVTPLAPREKRSLRIKGMKIVEESDKVLDSEGFGWSRKHSRNHYDQILDLVLYSQKEANNLGIDEIERRVTTARFDPRIGYLAMLRDFTFFLRGWPYGMLTLQGHMPDLCSRVKVRREMLREDQIEEEE